MKNSIDRAAGAGALARWPDVVMTLTEHEEPDCMTVEFSLRNFAPVPPFVVRWNQPVWQLDASLSPAKLKVAAGRIDRHPAFEALKLLGKRKLTQKKWAAALNWSESTLRHKIGILLSQGKIRLSRKAYVAV